MQAEEIFGTIGEYTLTTFLGDGAHSTVYQATKDGGKQYFACKFPKLNELNTNCEQQNIDMIMNESNILAKIGHQNIYKLYKKAKPGDLIYADKSEQKRSVMYSIVEYLPCYDLFSYILEEPFSEEMARFIFTKIIDGLKYLHEEEKIAHRDIKEDNIMLDKNYNLKIIDFGYASKIPGNNGTFTSLAGALSYNAPEMINKLPYEGSKVDIFAAGVTLFVIIMGVRPFEQADVLMNTTYRLIANKRIDEAWNSYVQNDQIRNTSQNLKFFLQSLWAYEPSDRPNFINIFEQNWMKGPLPDNNKIFTEFNKRYKNIIMKKESAKEESKAACNNKKNIKKGKKITDPSEPPKKKKKIEEIKKYKKQKNGKDLGTGDLMDRNEINVRKYDRPPEFITAQELYFEDEFILQFIIDFASQRNPTFIELHKKYMSVSVQMNHKNLGEVMFKAEVMRKNEDINVLVIDRITGDKFDFYSIYHEIIDTMIKAYSHWYCA